MPDDTGYSRLVFSSATHDLRLARLLAQDWRFG